MKKIVKNIYSSIRQLSTPEMNGLWGKVAFELSGKPFIKKDDINPDHKFPNNEKGGLIISADFEMAWAWRYSKGNVNCLDKGKIERDNFPEIIRTLEKFNIPVTFATVGHLFLDKCSKGEHDWMARIPYFDDHWKFTNGDWYDHDPYSNYKDAPEWYAPDLIDLVLKSKINHEIGTHSFSHVNLADKNCPASVAEDELKACIEAAKKFNIEFHSIVFPGGLWGNIEILKKYNLKIYRRHIDVDIAYPFRDSYGLLVSPSTGALEFNLKYGWSIDYFFKRIKKIIQKAMNTGTIAHFWFHPSLNPYFLLYSNL
jgi:peptidoglycan/xylan/chitin deacetylase (PgdA/CDA1 family)